MHELTLERILNAPPETIFAYVTEAKHLLNWWGPEGMHVADNALDMSRPGAYFAVIANAEGKRFKVSGVVTEIDPPRSVSFTWAWHDETDTRGHESSVRIAIADAGGGRSRLTLTQSGLPDEEAAENHKSGWNSTLNKLEGQFA